jgi:hypothetical protein
MSDVARVEEAFRRLCATGPLLVDALRVRGIDLGLSFFKNDDVPSAPRWAYAVGVVVEAPIEDVALFVDAIDRVIGTAGARDAIETILAQLDDGPVLNPTCEEAVRAYLRSIGAMS